jgi:Conserved TM helix
MQTTAVVQPTWWQSFVASLYGILGMMLRGLVKLIAFLLIIVIGWFISSLVAKAVAAVLRKLKIDQLFDRMGLANLTRKMGSQSDSAQIIAEVVKWLIRVVVLVVAFAALGIPAFSVLLTQLLLWLPNLAVAIVVLIVGGLVGNALAQIVRGVTTDAGFKNPDVLANVARAAIWAFAIVIAVNQVGIASTLVNTLFMGFVGAVALAAGLAFGIGGKELAGQLLEKWYGKGKKLGTQGRSAAEHTSR